MIDNSASRAWCPAVAPRLERGVRRHLRDLTTHFWAEAQAFRGPWSQIPEPPVLSVVTGDVCLLQSHLPRDDPGADRVILRLEDEHDPVADESIIKVEPAALLPPHGL